MARAKVATVIRPAEVDQKIVAPALYQKRIPEMYLKDEINEDSLQNWGEDLRDAWKKKFGGNLTNNAIYLIAAHGPDEKLRSIAGDILAIMGGQDCFVRTDGAVEAYTGEAFEKEQQRRMSAVVSKTNSEILVKTATTTVTVGEEGGKRYSLFGNNVSSVIRWMGKDGFTTAQCTQALKAFGIEVNPVTVQAQRSAGVKGQRGDPAPLTPAQQEQLRKAGGK